MTDAVLTRSPGSARANEPEAAPIATRSDRAQEYVARFHEIAHAGEPAWLSAQRCSGIARFASLGFPTTKDEDWHFTSLAPVLERTYVPAPHASIARSVPAESLSRELARFTFAGDWQTLVFLNGSFAPELSQVESTDTFYAGPMSHALRDDTRVPLVERHRGAAAETESHAFTALNSAFATDGAFIHVGANVVAPRHIHVLCVTDAAAEGALLTPRNVIVLEHHAEATVMESYVSLGDANYLTNAVTEASVADGARLRHYKIQRESINAYHVGSWYATQARDCRYEAFSFAIGSDLSRTNIATLLDGEGSHVSLDGLYLVNGDQTVDHQTTVIHAKESCTSHELYKGVLDGNSHAVFNGKVYVHPEAQKTDGKQSNNNLLLSDGARVDTKPQLEIFADDVKCTHGATIGPVDSTALFYLKSRGIGPSIAIRLLTYAFAAEVLEELTVPAVRDELERLAFERFAIGD
ncbi:MAG: Fe-S cluster assembly protein SufD [Gemmatimonadota bacterium]|nr:Fe-S cluster assembly protein SufD [Gemmatimonadota bacterium]